VCTVDFDAHGWYRLGRLSGDVADGLHRRRLAPFSLAGHVRGMVEVEPDSVLRATVATCDRGTSLGHDSLATKAVDQLADTLGKAPLGRAELDLPLRHDVSVGVDEPLQQCEPLLAAGAQILDRNVLVTKHTEPAKHRLGRARVPSAAVHPSGRDHAPPHAPNVAQWPPCGSEPIANLDVIGVARDYRARAVTIAEPHAEHVRIEGQVC